MKGKKPLAFLLVVVLAVGMVGAFAATPVAADDHRSDDDTNTNDCEATAANTADQTQNAVGAYIDQDQLSNQNAEASINNVADVDQANYQNSAQRASGSNVAQSSDQSASNTAVVSQCEANQNA